MLYNEDAVAHIEYIDVAKSLTRPFRRTRTASRPKFVESYRFHRTARVR